MEKRALLAIILSLMVLISFNALFSKQTNRVPQPTEEDFYLPEKPERQPVAESKNDITQASGPTLVSPDEVIQTIGTESFTVETSNIGGQLKSVLITEHNHKIPITNIFNLPSWDRLPFTFDGFYNNVLTYSFKNDKIEIVKRYDFSKDANLVYAEAVIKNVSSSSLTQDLNIENFSIDTTSLDKQKGNARDNNLYEYSASLNSEIIRTGSAFKFSPKNNIRKPGSIDWVGFRDKYFCILVKPQYTTVGYRVDAPSDHKLTTISEVGRIVLGPGERTTYNAIAYIGLQDSDKLKEYDLGFEKIVVFSKIALFNWISKSVILLMGWIHQIIPSWGVCIIIVAIMINGAMYPLTSKMMGSMKKMQSLQPEIAKIKEQHKSNPQKLQKEQMELFKEHKVNPLGGCLPMVLQLPVFFGVYQAMWRSVHFKGASFLWIKDLTQPDRLFILPFPSPFNELNVLPLIMVVIMFFQQKLSAKNMATKDPSQLAQQRIMGTFFPIFLGVIFYKFASGLCLYFTIFYILSAFTQWKMSKVTEVV